MHESQHPAPPEDEIDPLAFVPVPTATARYDGWTPRRQCDFIRALAVMGNVTHAVRAVGMSKQSAYMLRDRPGAESFAAAWDCALLMGYDRLFEQAMDRAINGITIPRYYRGKQIGTIHRPDFRMALAVLATPPAPAGKKKTR